MTRTRAEYMSRLFCVECEEEVYNCEKCEGEFEEENIECNREGHFHPECYERYKEESKE